MPAPTRRPIGFLATVKPDAALTFYHRVMGLRLAEQSPFALVFADDDTMLRVQIVQEFKPAGHTVHGWQVADIGAEMTELAAKGVAFVRFEALDQDRHGVWTTPDGNKVAWFKDPCGNLLSLTQFASP